ncbi:MAG: hypothetical protein K0S47_625 [Herbinix sp.]|jgi:hypothetical protein|nr:hypothetical protein [Herbinix sp.]
MGVNGVTNAVPSYQNNGVKGDKTNQGKHLGQLKHQDNQNEAAQSQEAVTQNPAAVYERSAEPTKKVHQRDTATMEKLKADAEKRTSQLRDLVEKLLLKQGHTLSNSDDIYSLLREGKVEVDEETRAQAQKDIAEDGYWGVKQTSDRIVSFAMALTGNDPSKADEMIDAVKKGFKEATKSWGADLPQISKDTLDASIKKLEEWRDSIQSDNQ